MLFSYLHFHSQRHHLDGLLVWYVECLTNRSQRSLFTHSKFVLKRLPQNADAVAFHGLLHPLLVAVCQLRQLYHFHLAHRL